MLLLVIITMSIVLICSYIFLNKSRKQDIKSETDKQLYLHLLQDLKGDKYVPWEEILHSKLVDSEELNQYLQKETYITQGEYDQSSDSYILKKYPISDILFVYWRSPQQSWDHLAGREGYVVISKSERRQIDFIMTTVS